MRIPHKSYRRCALAGGVMCFPQWRNPYQQTPQSRKRCNKPTRKISPSSHRSYMGTLPLNPAPSAPQTRVLFPSLRYLTVTGREERWRSTMSNVQRSPHQTSRREMSTRDLLALPNHIQATTTALQQAKDQPVASLRDGAGREPFANAKRVSEIHTL